MRRQHKRGLAKHAPEVFIDGALIESKVPDVVATRPARTRAASLEHALGLFRRVARNRRFLECSNWQIGKELLPKTSNFLAVTATEGVELARISNDKLG